MFYPLTLLIFQEEDILIVFYRNMLRSFPHSDLKTTLTFLSTSILLSSIPPTTTSNPVKLRSAVTQIKSVISKTLNRISEPLSISTLSHLRGLVNGVLTPKLSHVLTLPRRREIISTFLEGYLTCISSASYPKFRVETIQSNRSLKMCELKFHHGILLTLSRPKLTEKWLSQQQKRTFSVVIFSCPLPKELENWEGETVSFVNSSQTMEQKLVAGTIEILNGHLSRDPVDVVFSQKVVHHQIRQFLEQKGVLVLDRLSVFYAEDIATLARTTLSPSMGVWNVGALEIVGVVEIADKHFLNVCSSGTHFGTLLLQTKV
eukprot:sb/3466934/